ncbi:MAG: sulfatase [Spirochaetales bacterium]|nr:sulfatase [Spirochaetales bacterium]
MAEKPNIVMILIDDMGWKDLSCTGSEFYETPHIDRIRKQGMMFTRGYAPCPVCSPTRASLLTGKYPVSNGVTDWINEARPSDSPRGHARGYLLDAPYLDHLPLEEKSLAASLKEGGYQTWHVGKWHLGKEPYYPEHHGFDVNIGGCYKGSPGLGGYFSPWTTIPALKDADVPRGTYLTDYLTDKTLELIEGRDEDKPFFLNLWYYSVHTPVQAKKEKIRKYKAKAKAMGLHKVRTFEKGDRFPCFHKRFFRIKRRLVQNDPKYAAMIESLDENIGRVLDALEQKGLMDNTMIVFTSDNGGLSTAEGSPTCNLPLAEGKGWMYEGGVREPWLISWKGKIEENSSSAVPIVTTDLYPTFLEAASLPLNPEQHKDGVSLLGHLQGGKAPERDALFWHYPHYGNQGGTPGSSVLMHPWKLIEFFEDRRLELYHLEDDPGEQKDLSADHPERVQTMAARLHQWQAETGAKIPEPDKSFRPWSREHKAKGYKPWD